MKLAAVIICWNDWDLMGYCVENIRQLVDEVIIIGSTRSNYNELSPIPKHWLDVGMANNGVNLWIREPRFHVPMHSETDKRNYGLDTARIRGNTHFLMMDADEFYEPEQFLKAKERFLNPDLAGLVCPCNVYFGSPELTIGRDKTLIPFIHKITPTLKFEFNKRYPYAWVLNEIRIDPTRSMNINSGVEYTEEVVMHHYSHVRADYAKKIRNSSARKNLERSNILNDIAQAKEGYFVDFYRKRLTRCPNRFGIHVTEGEGIIHKDL